MHDEITEIPLQTNSSHSEKETSTLKSHIQFISKFEKPNMKPNNFSLHISKHFKLQFSFWKCKLRRHVKQRFSYCEQFHYVQQNHWKSKTKFDGNVIYNETSMKIQSLKFTFLMTQRNSMEIFLYAKGIFHHLRGTINRENVLKLFEMIISLSFLLQFHLNFSYCVRCNEYLRIMAVHVARRNSFFEFFTTISLLLWFKYSRMNEGKATYNWRS